MRECNGGARSDNQGVEIAHAGFALGGNPTRVARPRIGYEFSFETKLLLQDELPFTSEFARRRNSEHDFALFLGGFESSFPFRRTLRFSASSRTAKKETDADNHRNQHSPMISSHRLLSLQPIFGRALVETTIGTNAQWPTFHPRNRKV